MKFEFKILINFFSVKNFIFSQNLIFKKKRKKIKKKKIFKMQEKSEIPHDIKEVISNLEFNFLIFISFKWCCFLINNLTLNTEKRINKNFGDNQILKIK